MNLIIFRDLSRIPQYLIPYTISNNCGKYKSTDTIALTFTWNESVQTGVLACDLKILLGTYSFSGSLSSDSRTLSFSLDFNTILPGTYKMIMQKESQYDFPVNNETILVVNDYTIVNVSPNPLSVRNIEITFKYDFDYDSHKTYQLKQGTIENDITCTVTSSNKKLLSCAITNNFLSYESGEAQIEIGVLTCDSVDINDLQPVVQSIIIEKKTLLTALFTYEFSNFPVIGKQNFFRMTTEELYDLSNIHTITVKIIDYLGNERIISYTKTNNEYPLIFNEATFDITINFLYLPGDYIEITEIIDTLDRLSFPQGEHVYTHPCPVVISCPPLLNLNFNYKCNVTLTAWSTKDLSTLTQITIVDPSNAMITYCPGCANDITLDMSTNVYTITVNLPTADEYKIESIELDSIIYNNINNNYPIFIRETSLMSSISEVQFASDETIFTVGDYPSDAYLFVNNALAFPCIINADNKRQCEISTTANRPQNITEFKFIYKWIYYMIEQTAEFVIYDVIPSCVNSIDNIDRYAINVTTFTDDKFAGYKMYLNGDSSYSVDAEQISTKLFSYVFLLQNLQNGRYDSFYLDNAVNCYNISSTELFYYVDNSIVNIIYLNGTTLEQGVADQFVQFEFANDASFISAIKLTDLDEEMTIDGKFIEGECTNNLNILQCKFDMSTYYGYEYAISFISTCNDAEFPTNQKIVTAIAPKTLSTKLNFYVKDAIITMKILPKVLSDDVTSVTLEDINDGSTVDVANHKLDLKCYLMISASAISSFKIKVEVDGEFIEYAPITVVENEIGLIYDEIFLPKAQNRNYDKITIPLRNSIVMQQIEYVLYDDVDVTNFDLSSDGKIFYLNFSPEIIFDTYTTHSVKIKDKTQLSECVYSIHIVAPPQISFHQTLYLTDSTYKKDNFTVIYSELRLTNIYVKDANGYTPLNEKFVFDVDTSNEIIFSFGYKIETYGDYYYDIDTEIIVLALEYKNLFNFIVFLQVGKLSHAANSPYFPNLIIILP